LRSARKRLGKFARALPQVLEGDDPKSVHRARVAARRLEEYLAAVFPDSKVKKLRKFNRLLRRIRRDLGGWRNCDVVLVQLEKKRRRARNEARQSAWSLVETYVEKERRREIKRARRRIDGYDLRSLSDKLEGLPDGGKPDPAAIQASLDAAADRWQSALTAAEQSHSGDQLHEFRIATKKLRYRLEVAHQMGSDSPLLGTLRRLQRALGKWHDREVADHMIAEALARPKILLREFHAARMLLAELERDDRRQTAAAEAIIRMARGAVAAPESSEGPRLLLAFSRS